MESSKLKRSKQRLKRDDIKRINVKSLSDNEKQLLESNPLITLRTDNEELFSHLSKKQAGICFFCEHKIGELCDKQSVIELSVYIEKNYPSNDDVKVAVCEKCFDVGVIACSLNYDNLVSYLAERYRLKGKGQESLADDMDVNQATVSRIKNRKVDSVSLKVTGLVHKLFAEEYKKHKKNKEDIYERFIQKLSKSEFPIIKKNHMVLPKNKEHANHMVTCDLGIFNSKNELTAICFLESNPPTKSSDFHQYSNLLESFRAKYLIFFAKGECIYYELKNLMGQFRPKDKLVKINSIPPFNIETKNTPETLSSSQRTKPSFNRRNFR